MVDDRDEEQRMVGDGATATPGSGNTGFAATQPDGAATRGDDTLVPRVRPTPVPALPLPGYQLGELIGRGGMGEVVAGYDQRIGREVAIKRMRTATPSEDQLARFLREARVQARLDHPAIVPVHELGTDESGRPYFTMKRISGKTLAEHMAAGTPQNALLRAFADVCLAIDRAHSRSVVHRDLKPQNIMLGDYGEVYVLDWGIARLLSDEPEVARAIDTLDDGTQTGAMLGTPGYMSPEQARGIPATPAADVYALGAILFEILAGEPLHPRGTDAIASTLATPQESPAHRRADTSIAPELASACHAALAEDPTARPTPRVLADQVQAYLDGDRDVESRRVLANQHLARARAALEQGGSDGRAIAIREAGHALALSPTSGEAAALLGTLLVEPPDPLPPALQASLEAEDRKATALRARLGTRAYLFLFAFWPVFPLLGIKSWAWLVALFSVVSMLAAGTWLASRRGRYNIALGLAGNLALAVVWTRLAGTFLLTPVVACGVLLALTTHSWLRDRRWAIVGYATATVLVPVALEYLGWMPKSWEVTLTSIVSHSTIFEMEGVIADLSLIGASIVFVSIVGLFAARVHAAAKEARRKLAIQAWHLKQLVPRSAGLPTTHELPLATR